MDGECFNVDEFVASNDGYCLIVPEVIAYISKKMDIANDFNGVIVDTYKKTQYMFRYLKLLVAIEVVQEKIWTAL